MRRETHLTFILCPLIICLPLNSYNKWVNKWEINWKNKRVHIEWFHLCKMQTQAQEISIVMLCTWCFTSLGNCPHPSLPPCSSLSKPYSSCRFWLNHTFLVAFLCHLIQKSSWKEKCLERGMRKTFGGTGNVLFLAVRAHDVGHSFCKRCVKLYT